MTGPLKGIAVLAGILAAVGGCDSDLSVPAPEATERADTVALLKQAHERQGICYGWRLYDRNDQVSVGSNFGDGVAVADNPSCPRWVEVRASVTYAPESSESEDWSSVEVYSSSDLGLHGLDAYQRLTRFGLDNNAFIDDPGWAVSRAATVLPLLMVEAGEASIAPVATAAPSSSPPALVAAGSDLWRDRWIHLLVGGGLLLSTVAFFIIGWKARRRERVTS